MGGMELDELKTRRRGTLRGLHKAAGHTVDFRDGHLVRCARQIVSEGNCARPPGLPSTILFADQPIPLPWA